MSADRFQLIVGASGSIGSAVARQLASPGAHLGLHYRANLARAAALKSQLEAAGARCELMQSSLDSETACGALVETFVRHYGHIDGLALCAGTINWTNWRELSDNDWQRALFEHCLAPFYVARHAAAGMDQARAGRIVFLSSIAPKYGGSAETMHYAAAKAALEAAMRGLARQLAHTGIRINGVRAGFVDTPLHSHGRTPQEITERIAKIPVGRAGTAEEVASAVAYLMSDSAGFINGELLAVAGGD